MAIDLTGITSENEFFSGHYLAALIEDDLRGVLNEWRNREAEQKGKTPWALLSSLSGGFFDLCSRLGKIRPARERLEAQRNFLVPVLKALGYEAYPRPRELDDGTVIPVFAEVTRSGGEPLLWCFEVAPSQDEGIGLLEASLVPDQFPEQVEAGFKFHGELSFEELLSRHVFTRDEPPRWIILAGGSQVLLLDREKWREKRALRFDLDEIFSRRETTTLQAMAVLLHRESLCPGEGESLLDRMEAESRRHASSVSDDLRYALRQAIELLGNDAVRDFRERQKVGVFGEGDLDPAQLSLECLRFLYRLLFLLFVESRPELGYAPLDSETYRTGYSLESLRDLETVPLVGEEAENGTFFDASLRKLFELVFKGYPRTAEAETEMLDFIGEKDSEAIDELGAFRLRPLPSHLFDPARTPLLEKVRFRNNILQKVIRLLSLSKPDAKKGRGRVSYARLGIGQLGAVYEGLLSYTGFFAREDLYEVRPEDSTADELDVAYFVNAQDLQEFSEAERVKEEGVIRKYPKGTFIYRLAGRERQKSASYYTPESLVKCLVKYALKGLLEGKSADEVLKLTFCEPAMGSAAFLNEVIDQVAEAYLQRKQEETGQEIPLNEYGTEKQRVKMFLADNNAFGVDLNPVAVELAEVSLWLGTIHRDAPVPWFGMQLACGNSLIGARRAVFAPELLVKREKGETTWQDAAPVLLKEAPRPKGHVYHFFLPDKGMADYTDKVVKEMEPEATERIKKWRKDFCRPFSKSEIGRLEDLSEAVDRLWSACAEEQARLRADTSDPMPLFGQPKAEQPRTTTGHKDLRYGQEILSKRVRVSSPYRRLKLALDYWCALWFWPLEKAGQLPSREECLFDLELVLKGGVVDTTTTPETQMDLFPTTARLEAKKLADDLGMVNLETLRNSNPRLQVSDELTRRYRFLHWEVEFADIFKTRGGFDLVLGNPPWIKVEWTEGDILGDSQPLFVFRKYTATQLGKRRIEAFKNNTVRRNYLSSYEESAGQQNFLNACVNYPNLLGMKANLYKCFMPLAWRIGSKKGSSAFLHPEGVYDDPKGGSFRQQMYQRLAFHFQFQNEKKLFPIGNRECFSINVYGPQKEVPNFIHLANLYETSTVDACFQHDGSGPLPGIKTDEDQWNTSGHRKRLVPVSGEELSLFARLYDDPGTPALEARLPALHGQPLIEVLRVFASAPKRLGDIDDEYYTTQMWNETSHQNDGTIRRETRFPDMAEQWVLSGPHFFVGNPFHQTPRRICETHRAYDPLDLTTLPNDYLPRTNYVVACSPAEYIKRIPTVPWEGKKVTEYFKFAHRALLSQAGERTMISAIYPPGCGAINQATVSVFRNNNLLIAYASFAASLVADFLIKTTGKPKADGSLLRILPLFSIKSPSFPRYLVLSCLTNVYAPLWCESWEESFVKETWTSNDPRLPQQFFSKLTPRWQRNCALRSDIARRQALIEIDVLAAMEIDMTLDQLIAIYRVQFPVLRQYESDTWYDMNGRIVFTSKGLPGVGFDRKDFEEIKNMKQGTVTREMEDDTLPGGPRKRVIEYVAPFAKCDREADYRRAWEVFSARKGL